MFKDHKKKKKKSLCEIKGNILYNFMELSFTIPREQDNKTNTLNR